MNKNQVEKKVSENNFIKYLPIIVTMATIIIGIWQFTKNSEKEIRKEFFYKQVQSYEDIVKGVSGLMSNQSMDRDSLRKQFSKFKELTEGTYLLYTTDTVHYYVLTFNYYFERYIKNDTITRVNMETIKYKLVNSCRYSLNQTLGVDLKEIDFRKSLK